MGSDTSRVGERGQITIPRRRAELSLALEDELASVSAEADVGLGDAPEW